MRRLIRPIVCFVLLLGVSCSRDESGGGKSERLKDMLKTQAEKLRVVTESRMHDIGEWGKEQLNEFLRNLSEYRPVLREAGFEIDNIRVKAGLVPAATLCCRQLRKLDTAERKRLQEKYREQTMKSLLLTLLYKAYEIEVPGYMVDSIWITISPAPNSVVIFTVDQDSSSE